MIIEGFTALAVVLAPTTPEIVDLRPVNNSPVHCVEDVCIINSGDQLQARRASEAVNDGSSWSRLSKYTWEFCTIPVYINYEGGWGRDFRSELQLVADMFDLTLLIHETEWRGEDEYDVSPHNGITFHWPKTWTNQEWAGLATNDADGRGYYSRSSIALRPGNYSDTSESYLFYHELGHALGLGHVADQHQIMSYNTDIDWYNWGDYEGIMEVTSSCRK